MRVSGSSSTTHMDDRRRAGLPKEEQLMSDRNVPLRTQALAEATAKHLREQEAAKGGSKTGKAASNGKPIGPPRPLTVLERMKVEIVPLDELLASMGELIELAKADEDRYRVERAETTKALKELREIRVAFRPILEGKRGEARKAVINQITERKVIVARTLGEAGVRDLDAFDQLDELIQGYGDNAHRGNFGYVLRQAAAAGFLEEISPERAEEEINRGRKHLVFSDRFRGTERRYFPVRIDAWRLSRTLAWEIRDLHFRSLRTADRERATQYAFLEAGTVPGPAELQGLLTSDGRATLTKPVSFGCMLIQLAFRNPARQSFDYFNGVSAITLFDRDGVRYIGMSGVNGSASRVLPTTPTCAPVSLKQSQTADWARWVVNHLLACANGVLATDEQAATHNVAMHKKGRVEECVPEKQVERSFRYAELRGDEWRARNSGWIKRKGAAALAEIYKGMKPLKPSDYVVDGPRRQPDPAYDAKLKAALTAKGTGGTAPSTPSS